MLLEEYSKLMDLTWGCTVLKGCLEMGGKEILVDTTIGRALLAFSI